MVKEKRPAREGEKANHRGQVGVGASAWESFSIDFIDFYFYPTLSRAEVLLREAYNESVQNKNTIKQCKSTITKPP